MTKSLLVAAALVAAFLMGLANLRAQEPISDAEQVEALTWIPPTCCVTNRCCWKVDQFELQSLSGDRWLVRATGQTLPRTDYSKDGKYWRCACDQDGADPSSMTMKWKRHNGANTRCIFVPMMGS